MSQNVWLVCHALPAPDAGLPARAWQLSAEGLRAASALDLPRNGLFVACEELVAGQTLWASAPDAEIRRDPRLGDVRRDKTGDGVDLDDLRARYLAGEQLPGWEDRAAVAARITSAVDEYVAAACGRPVVLGGHAVALTVWLASVASVDDPVALWAGLGAPDVIHVQLPGEAQPSTCQATSDCVAGDAGNRRATWTRPNPIAESDGAPTAWSGVHTGVLRPGERVGLVDVKGRRHSVVLRPGTTFHTTKGGVAHDDIIGQPDGSLVVTAGGLELLVFRSILSQYMVSMPREAAVIYPKDAAQILMWADIFPGARVLEAGVGSGALTLALLRAIGPRGRLYSYERRAHFAEVARTNVTEFFGGTSPRLDAERGRSEYDDCR